MLRPRGAAAALFLAFAGLLLAACAATAPPKPSQVETAIAGGFAYLAGIRTPDGAYKDAYLQYIYPGEELACPLDTCNLTYRTLDAYFNLKFIQQSFPDAGPLAADVARADEIMRSLLPAWRQSRLYNIQQPTMIDPDGLALDTYCILGYLYRDAVMARVAKDSLQGWDWLPEGFYMGDAAFRTIADESWCTRLLVVTGTDAALARALAHKSVKETRELVSGGTTPVAQAMAYYHTLLILHDLRDGSDRDTIADFQRQLARLAVSEALWKDTVTMANILDALASTNASDGRTMDRLAAELVARQGESGVWYADAGVPVDSGQVFATLRALSALQAYRGHKGWTA